MPWKLLPDSTQILKQCWFLGFHTDIGGGNVPGVLAHVALIWMMDQLNNYLSFNISNLWTLLQNQAFTIAKEQQTTLVVRSDLPGETERASLNAWTVETTKKGNGLPPLHKNLF
jgi:hypothetical protein